MSNYKKSDVNTKKHVTDIDTKKHVKKVTNRLIRKKLYKDARRTIGVLSVLTIVLLGIILYFRYGRDLIRLNDEAAVLVSCSDADTFRQNQTSIIYDCNNEIIKTVSGEKDVYYIEYEDIPEEFKEAFIAVEDRKFNEHIGIDMKGILRAGMALITHKGNITQGGSTITQQLAKNVFLTNEVTWTRKVEEALIAIKLEKKYSKEDIMEFYLNNIYFGNGYYGIGAAAKGYFNCDVDELSLSQIAFLCAIPNNPTDYNPVTNMNNTLDRRDKILKNMCEVGYIDNVDLELNKKEEITLNRPENPSYNYVETYIYYCATRALMEQAGFQFKYVFESEEAKNNYYASYNELYNQMNMRLFNGGLRIYTTIDLNKQEMLQKAIDEGLKDNQETNEEGILSFQGAAVCIDNSSGKVNAIVGGRSQEYEGYTLNRAYQSFRQPGSSIKPLLVYTPMLERGYTRESLVDDSPIEGGPKNSGGYEGTITLLEAVKKSKNVVAYRLYEELTPMVGMQYLIGMQFSRISIDDRNNLSTALGGFEYGTSPVEMASGYATLANNGLFRNPSCVRYINDAEDNTIISLEGNSMQIYTSEAAASMTEILTHTFDAGGTAYGYALDNCMASGKTGTTNSNKDGWFCGYTSNYTVAVWVGYDMPQTMNELWGNTYPVQIWNSYMNDLNNYVEDSNGDNNLEDVSGDDSVEDVIEDK